MRNKKYRVNLTAEEEKESQLYPHVYLTIFEHF
jgi:hypothetical protein